MENPDEESVIETPSTLEEATLPKANTILPPLELHPPSTPTIETSDASASADNSEEKASTIDSFLEHMYPHKHKRSQHMNMKWIDNTASKERKESCTTTLSKNLQQIM